MVQAGGIYVLVNVNTDTCLDENLGNNWVRAWGRNIGDNQKWLLDRQGPGRRWSVRNVASGRFLCPESDDPGTGLRTEESPYLWHITSDEQGPRLCISAAHADEEDNKRVLLPERKGDKQVWYFEEA
ncbi:RICIN domain-containing protein [Nonomuraea sp. NPDC000554]|uniref:RICIN domain-containing protein n=1 Tax=Nonomuraea sp. NPDC000554 TaxID=3154259 RepID=UPI00331A0634